MNSATEEENKMGTERYPQDRTAFHSIRLH